MILKYLFSKLVETTLRSSENIFSLQLFSHWFVMQTETSLVESLFKLKQLW